jgi:hypothetical protein
VLTAFLGLAAAVPAWADDAADARAIIDKGIQAAGGKNKLAKFKAQTWDEKGTYYGSGEGQAYTGKYAMQWPDKFRMEILNVFTMVVNGDQGWFNAGGQVMDLSKEQLDGWKGKMYAGWVASLLPLDEKGYTLKTLPEIQIDKKPAVGVRVSRKGHVDVDLYFDKGTGLLARSEFEARSDEQNKQVKQEASFTDYKEFAGIKVPTKLVIKHDGKVYLEAEHTDIKPAEKLDEKTFAKP